MIIIIIMLLLVVALELLGAQRELEASPLKIMAGTEIPVSGKHLQPNIPASPSPGIPQKASGLAE